MIIKKFQTWDKKLQECEHLIIAGPCSAESESQTLKTAIEIAKINKIKVYRAGIWKPRTTPNSFEGVGQKALPWLKKVKQQTGLLTTVEVATPEHIEICLKNQDSVDFFWLGARTVANPFSMQAIADALAGVDIPVMVKNPIIPELKLWIGAIERLYKKGINKIAAIHRGFYPFEQTKYRNIPKLELLVEFKSILPQIQIIGDPSHIAGKRSLLLDVINILLAMNVDGLMIESHINPSEALSDAEQQITPMDLKILLENLNFTKNNEKNMQLKELQQLRLGIDSLDYQLLELLSKRIDIVKKIAIIKKQNNISPFQLDRWREIVKTRLKFADELNLDRNLTKKILQMIHKESIEIQTKII
jgi:chorismate mutase